MADPVLRPLVDRGLGPNLQQLQRYGDGQSDMGAGVGAARAMQPDPDASTAGGLYADSPGKYSALPAPMSSLIRESFNRRPSGQVR